MKLKRLFQARFTMMWVALFIAVLTIPNVIFAQGPDMSATCNALRADVIAFQSMIIGYGYFAGVAAIAMPELFAILATLAMITNLLLTFNC